MTFTFQRLKKRINEFYLTYTGIYPHLVPGTTLVFKSIRSQLQRQKKFKTFFSTKNNVIWTGTNRLVRQVTKSSQSQSQSNDFLTLT
jgi:hypothetical protein